MSNVQTSYIHTLTDLLGSLSPEKSTLKYYDLELGRST